MLQQILKSERYQRLILAVRRGDFQERRAIFAEGIAQSTGVERAHWLLIRAGGMFTLLAPPLDAIRSDVDAALALAPEDPEIVASAGLTILGIVMKTEQAAEMGHWWRIIPRAVRQTPDPWMFHSNFGLLAWRRQRLGPALRHFNKVLAEMAVWAPERLQAYQGRYFLAHCSRANIALEAGEMELAERDIQAADAMYESVSHVYVSDRLLALAKAGLALHRGDLQGARQALQMIRAREREPRYTRDPYFQQAEMDLVAARIALAEGNLPAFHHFTEQALGLAERNRMAMTARRIRAIRDRLLAESGRVGVQAAD